MTHLTHFEHNMNFSKKSITIFTQSLPSAIISEKLMNRFSKNLKSMDSGSKN